MNLFILGNVSYVVSTSLRFCLFHGNYQQWERYRNWMHWQVKHADTSLCDPQTLCKWTMSFVGLKCNLCSNFSNAHVLATFLKKTICFRTLNVDSTSVSFFLLSNICLFESTVNVVGKVNMNIVPCQSQDSLFKCKTEDKWKTYWMFLVLEQDRVSVLLKNVSLLKQNYFALEPILQP